jgi:glycosyltransferase involved in cell wall biosynthesis
MMRILMLTQFYHPIIGGEERIVQDLSVELARRGHEVSVVTLWHEGFRDQEIDRGVHIFRIHSTTQRAAWLYRETQRRHAPPWPDPETTWALRRILAQVQPEIVHAHNWLVYSFLPLKLQSRSSLVLTLHDYSLLCAKRRLVYRGAPCDGPGLIKCLACSREHYGLAKGIPTALGHRLMSAVERSAVDMFLPISRAVAVGNGLVGSSLPFKIIPNFVPDNIDVDRSDFESYVARLPKGDYLLFVGDLSRDKGIHILLSAYAGLKNAPPLVLIGRRCMDTPAELPPNVIFLESWPHGAVMEAWRRCSLAVAPSVWSEPFGVVVLEAMALGRPVVASRAGGLSDIVVDGETGLLVPPGDPAALRLAIEQLLADRDLREQMGQAGKQRVEQYQAGVVVPRIEQVYGIMTALEPSAEFQQAIL